MIFTYLKAISVHDWIRPWWLPPCFRLLTLVALAVASTPVAFSLGPIVHAADEGGRASSTAPTGSVGESSETAAGIVAVVNGETITRPELAQMCLKRYGKSVLESLVNKHLILQACREAGVDVTSADIEEEIERIAGRFNLPKKQWLTMLREERHIAPEQYRRDIIWPTLALKRLAADKLTVTNEELQKALEREYGPKVQVRMIATKNEKKAQRLLELARAKPDDFSKLAKQYSEDANSAAARGLIPPIRRHLGEPIVEQAAFALEPGEISDILSVANQYLILKCEKHLPAVVIAPQHRQVAVDRLREQIIDQKLRESSSEIFARLQKSANVINVLNDEKLRKQRPGVAALINGQRISTQQLAEECIARHGRDVLESAVNERLLKQALARSGKTVTRQEIQQEIARAAETYGYVTGDKKPDIKRWLKDVIDQENMTVETYVRDAVWPSVALKKLVADEVEVTEDDLQKGFAANYGERVEVLAIVLSNQRIAQEVWDMARGNLTAHYFGELAAEYSIEPVSRANMGEVPPIRRFSGQPQIEEEAFSLTREDPLSAIVAIADKYVIMYYLGRTRPVVDRLDEVREELSRDLREKKTRLAMAQRFELLQQTAQIDNFLAGKSQSPRRTGRLPDSAVKPASADRPVRQAQSSPTLFRPGSRAPQATVRPPNSPSGRR